MVTPPPAASAPSSSLLFVTRAARKGGPPASALTVPATPARKLTARLVVVRGERLERAFALLDGKNFIGRTADFAVDIDLDGQETPERTWASRRHALVTVEATGVSVEDLHSLNGTFVNRQRIHPGTRKPLKSGDILQVGTVQLKLTVG